MKKKFILSLCFTVFGMGLFSIAYGVSSYKTQFNNFYAAKGIVTAGSAIDQCLLCHTTNTGANASNLNSYGNAYASSYNFGTIESQDSDGDGSNNLAEITAKTFPGDPNSRPTGGADTTKPTVSAFTIPATSTTLAVSITSLTATDNIGVTGYRVTESATAPLASAAGWTAARPASYTFATAGAKTLYAWAKDAAGNVSLSRSASVTITLPPTADTTKPTVSAFTIPATSTTLAIPITSLTATDNVGVTGYMVTELATAPTASAAGWTAAAPSSYTFGTAGAKTLRAWAKDAAGNVSLSRSALVRITLPSGTDTVKPTVSAFTIPATSTTLAVPITSLAATDNVGVTGYMVKESLTAPAASAAGWSAAAPMSYTFATAGLKTLRAWVKDAAGNVSLARAALVTIKVSTPPPSPGTLPDMTNWVGKWFKITERNTGYYIRNSALAIDRSSVVAYLKIWDWDSSQKIFHVDRYEYDAATSQWFSEPIDLNYVSGSQQAFLCWYQTTDNATQNMIGFTVLFQELGANWRTLKTLGGYYVASGEDSAGSSVNYIGGLTINGSEVSISIVPVPSSLILR
jgi:hypothetical protein